MGSMLGWGCAQGAAEPPPQPIHDESGAPVLATLHTKDSELTITGHGGEVRYSLLDSQGPKLVSKLGHLLGRKRIAAWYWGHEHRCVLYDAHPAWGVLGRCIGHGGYPYFREGIGQAPLVEGTVWRRLDTRNLVPGGVILDAPNRYVTGEEEKYGANGYLTLEFDGGHLNESIHDPDGSVLRERQIV